MTSSPFQDSFAPLLLHGHDVDPASLLPSAAALQAELLAGPLETRDGRRAWFEVGNGAAAACAFVRASTEVAGRVVIGYSQGAAVAFALGCDGEPAPAGVVTVAGFVADDVNPADFKSQYLLVVHADDDEVVDPFYAGLLARQAAKSGAHVTQASYEGGHVWTDAVTVVVREWLQSLDRTSTGCP